LAKDKVYLGDKSNHDVERQGIALFILGARKAMTIKNVLYIPTLKKSLIFVNRVIDASYGASYPPCPTCLEGLEHPFILCSDGTVQTEVLLFWCM